MREYAKVRSRFWTRGTGKRLPPMAKLVAQNLMSCQSGNMIGLYYVPVALIADETGLDRQGALEALESCIREGFCKYDEESSCVWVVNAAREQLLAEGEEALKPNDHRVRGVEKLLRGLEDHPFYADFINHYKDILCIGSYVAPEKPGRPRRGSAKPSQSPSRAPLEPVSSEQRAESSRLESARADAPPTGQETEPDPKTAARPTLVATRREPARLLTELERLTGEEFHRRSTTRRGAGAGQRLKACERADDAVGLGHFEGPVQALEALVRAAATECLRPGGRAFGFALEQVEFGPGAPGADGPAAELGALQTQRAAFQAELRTYQSGPKFSADEQRRVEREIARLDKQLSALQPPRMFEGAAR